MTCQSDDFPINVCKEAGQQLQEAGQGMFPSLNQWC